jgi:uncharacterized BrkB/YihY/UPF0761 family membrane protein
MSDIMSAMQESDISSFTQMIAEDTFWTNPTRKIKNWALAITILFTTAVIFLILFVVLCRTTNCKRLVTCILLTTFPKSSNSNDLELQEQRSPEA